MADGKETERQNLDIYNIGNCVAIIRLAPIKGDPRPQIYYQVTIDQTKYSPSKKFIQLGKVNGDELIGWKPVQDIEVMEVLFEYEDKEIPYIDQPQVEVA